MALELPITGMTCASCANRIERKLNKLDGVSATVNYATETATVDYDPEVAQPDELLGAVQAAGYQVLLPTAEPAHNDRGHEDHDLADDETVALRRRLVISAVLSFPVLLMAMVPALQFDNCSG
jgi:P-type Cu+ transporter